MSATHPLAATLAEQREMIATAGRKAMTHGQYMSACEAALRFAQSPELAAALAALPGGGVDGWPNVSANVTVSVDVSRGEHDAENRIFALTTGEVMDHDGEPVILCIEESRNFNRAEACFACSRKIGRLQSEHEVDTRDGQTAYVGSECFKKIKAAGDEGWQPPKGGPRLFLLSPTPPPHEADRNG